MSIIYAFVYVYVLAASDYINCDTVPILTDHITEWERCLNRQDVIRIKDHLLQEAIITFEENEEFVNDKNYYNRDKTHLFSQIVRKVKASTSKGSVMCFIQHAENIIEHKQCGQKLIQIIKDQLHERMQPGNVIFMYYSIKKYKCITNLCFAV